MTRTAVGSGTTAARLLVGGRVQGVGFRPYVHRLAAESGLAGWVRNTPDGVEITVEGPADAVAAFADRLAAEAPPPAAVASLSRSGIPPSGLRGFRIDDSAPAGPVAARVPADLAVCPACRAEAADPADRRFGHPFANCTACGPRFTIVDALPYDRPATSMARFKMCDACRREYASPADRRFHAQPIACPACGPTVRLLDRSGNAAASGPQAVTRAAALLRSRGVLSLKGVGGFQLLVRADDPAAVRRLRDLKHRPAKPLAVMVASLAGADAVAELSDAERAALASPENPILLVRRRPGRLCDEIAPGLAWVGLMLPTTPLHAMLAEAVGRPLVATSGNLGDEPPVLDEAAAPARLAGVADAHLVHDRPIRRRADDSVARLIDGRVRVLRLGRGYAPQPLPQLEALAAGRPPILAVGGHPKSALAAWTGRQAVLGPHLGDLDSAAARDGFAAAADDLRMLYRFKPAAVACDRHPDYFTTRCAESLGPPIIRVGHHRAHALAVMAEHGLLGRRVAAVTWDGTGFGDDGTIWGGEILVIGPDGSARRVGSLRPFRLPGGDAAMRRPGRIAIALLAESAEPAAPLRDAGLLAGLGLSRAEAETLRTMAARGVNSPWTSSVGRLFDAVAAIALGASEVSYEGEAAARLESVADPAEAACYDLPASDDAEGVARADWRPLIAQAFADRCRNRPPGRIAGRFHNALARWAAEVVRRTGAEAAVLGGGCFANRLLAERTAAAIRAAGVAVFLPEQVPPGDGGLAVGQLAAAVLAEG